MNSNKPFTYFFLLAFAFWLLPFMFRLFMVEIPQIDDAKLQQFPRTRNRAMQESIQYLSAGNKQGTFVSIFKNNIKSCIFNILGGVFLGLGTLVNLIYNGFIFADIYVSSHNAGISTSMLLKLTLPHSFELIGIWLSGGIGFYIAWLIICFMRGKENFTPKICKLIGIYSAIMFLIILSAAYVEAFISSTFL